MSTQIWLTSDPHFFHANMLRGRKIGIRPFDTLDEMHSAIIGGWNSVVKPNDKVYMLGDLTLERPKKLKSDTEVGENWKKFEALTGLVQQLQGQKRMLLGNHDHWPAQLYVALGFDKVLAYRELGGLILSHIPVHPNQMQRFRGNVHGHLHDNVVTEDYEDRYGIDVRKPDRRYVNVSVERTNYTPVNFDEIRSRFT